MCIFVSEMLVDRAVISPLATFQGRGMWRATIYSAEFFVPWSEVMSCWDSRTVLGGWIRRWNSHDIIMCVCVWLLVPYIFWGNGRCLLPDPWDMVCLPTFSSSLCWISRQKSRRPMDPSWDMEKIEPGKSMDRTLDVSWIRSAERAWLKKISLSQW